MDTPNIESCFKLFSKYTESEFELGKLIASLETEISETGSEIPKPKQDEQKVVLSDMLQTVFNDLGQFCGVVLRQDLVLPLWYSNTKNMNALFKAMNACCYINRLIRDGLQTDFNLQAKQVDSSNVKEYAD